LYTDLASIYERAGRILQYSWFLGVKKGEKVFEVGRINTVNYKIEGLQKTTLTKLYELEK
jgi:hypothetical protein